MFDIGMQELIVIFIIALLVFGPKKLPELSRAIGKGLTEFKRSLYGVKKQLESEFKEATRDIEETVKSGKREVDKELTELKRSLEDIKKQVVDEKDVFRNT